MPKKVKLTESKAKWSASRNRKVIRGKPLNYNAGIQAKMKNKLDKMVVDMLKTTEREIKNIFNSDNIEMTFDADISSVSRIQMNALMKNFEKIFRLKGKSISESMVENTEKTVSANLHESIKELSGGLSIKTSQISAQTTSIMKASITDSTNLIKSIQSKYLNDVSNEVFRSITQGQGIKDLIPYLIEKRGVTRRRAKTIALDQTRKAYSSVARSKMEEAGIKKFEWKHSGAGAVPRKEHVAHDGKIYSFDNLPKLDGKDDYPGWAINCKCTSVPVIEFDES